MPEQHRRQQGSRPTCASLATQCPAACDPPLPPALAAGPTWNWARVGRPPGSSPGAKQVAHSPHSWGGAGPPHGGWSGGGQRVPLAKARQHWGISGEAQVRKSSSQEAAGVASQEDQGARAAALTCPRGGVSGSGEGHGWQRLRPAGRRSWQGGPSAIPSHVAPPSSLAWLSRESGSQPATEQVRLTSPDASLTLSPSTTNMTGGPTLGPGRVGHGGGRAADSGGCKSTERRWPHLGRTAHGRNGHHRTSLHCAALPTGKQHGGCMGETAGPAEATPAAQPPT